MIRYGIQQTIDGKEPSWIAIGTGMNTDVQFAHLYTTKELAQAKIKTELKAHQNWIKHTGNTITYTIVEFTVKIK